MEVIKNLAASEPQKWEMIAEKIDLNFTELSKNKSDKSDLGGLKFWKGTQETYDLIEMKDPNTLYIITK